MATTTASSIKLFVSGKPVSINSAYQAVRPRARRDGKKARTRALTPSAVAWKELVTWDVYQTGARGRFTRPAISYAFQGVRGDVDNYIKLTADSIAAALDLDDKHFKIAGASARSDGLPGVWLTIEEAV